MVGTDEVRRLLVWGACVRVRRNEGEEGWCEDGALAFKGTTERTPGILTDLRTYQRTRQRGRQTS